MTQFLFILLEKLRIKTNFYLKKKRYLTENFKNDSLRRVQTRAGHFRASKSIIKIVINKKKGI